MSRAFLDANVFISYLLYPAADGAPSVIVRAGIAGTYSLVTSGSLVNEFRRKVTTKPYLMSQIAPEDLLALTQLLNENATVVPELPEPYPAVGVDRKDDYLFAHALLGRADYLVSGDDHLLRIGHVEDVRIVSPGEFLTILETAGSAPEG